MEEATAEAAAIGTEPAGPEPRWLDWAPLGLWTAGALAALRIAVLTASARRTGGADVDAGALAWDLAGQFPQALGQALVVGLATAALLASARAADRERLPWTPLVFAGVLFWSVLSGWPLAPASQRSGLLLEPALDDTLVQAVLAGALTFALWFALRLSEQRGARRFLRGPIALGVALVAGALLPTAHACSTARRAPTYTRRVVVHDFVEELDTVRMRSGADPVRTVITPVVAWETDSGDKPALQLTPPAEAVLTVPTTLPGAADGERLFLRAAAGVHKSVYDHMPDGVDRVGVVFAVDVNGARAWEHEMACERPRRGQWDPSKRVWQHAGGATGLAVAPGDEVVLSARLTEPALAAAFDPAKLRLGFGGLVIEREIEDERTRATPQAPNILLVVMDTQRADRMSCYGYERLTTPRLDRLASRGILFENAYATSSWTWPSTASILTGLPADAHGVTSNESCTLVRSLVSLPEVLQDQGFKTAGFAANPLIAPERYFDQGFEDFTCARGEFWMSDEVVPDVLDWLERNRGMRFFLYLHLADPHIPHRPHEKEAERLGLVEPEDLPEGGMGHYERVLNQHTSDPEFGLDDVDALIPAEHQRWLTDVYDASVATGDRWTGEVLDKLDELGLADRTIVAFTADHGEELLDRARLGHGHTLHQELVRVPLILAGPGIPAGVRTDAVLSNRHLAPTLATLGGGDLAGMGDGIFLPDVLEADPAAGAFVQTDKGLWDGASKQKLLGLRRDEFFLQVRARAEGSPQVRLYRLDRDPAASLDVAAERPERTEEMFAELQRRLALQLEFAPGVRIGAGVAMSDVLKAIGYGGDSDD